MTPLQSLSLDPSVNSVGWSTFNFNARTRHGAYKWGTFKLEGMNFEMRCTDLIQKIGATVGSFDFLITEKPAFFSSERGQIAAHQNYTIDLAAIAFYVAGWYQMDHRHHFAMTANQWKGSVSKVITARQFFRSFKAFDVSATDEHAIDAVMMHRFWLQSFAPASPEVLRAKPRGSWRSLV